MQAAMIVRCSKIGLVGLQKRARLFAVWVRVGSTCAALARQADASSAYLRLCTQHVKDSGFARCIIMLVLLLHFHLAPCVMLESTTARSNGISTS